MKHKSLYIIVLFLIVGNVGKSQTDTIYFAKNTLHLEILGAGGYGSVNYEKCFFKGKYIQLDARIGLSTYHIKDCKSKFNPDIVIPINVLGLYGNDKHNFVFGLGRALSSITKIDHVSWQLRRQRERHTFFTLGYRYQKKSGGFVAGCYYNPIIEFHHSYRRWFGALLGYAF